MPLIITMVNDTVLNSGKRYKDDFFQPIFGFWSLLATKFKIYFVISGYILQGKMGKTEKRKENHATEVTKRQKYGRNETLGVIFDHWPKL